jgi:uncharacterized protein YlxW (UPF0749 family)
MVAELDTNASSTSAAYMTALQQYVPTPEFTQHYQHLQELMHIREAVLQQQELLQELKQQRQRQQRLQQERHAYAALLHRSCTLTLKLL